jgi:Tol biopolymer transport system component
MKKIFFTLLLLLLCGGFLYAQPKAVGEPQEIAKMDTPLRKPVWSSDGKNLTLTSLKDVGMWEVSASGTNFHQVSTEPVAGLRSAIIPVVPEFDEFNNDFVYNAVLSPQGNQIVFQVSNGKGMYVCNVDGSGLRNLGQGERASWTPDGKYVIVMLTADDGEVVTQGELLSIHVTSGARTTLLSSDKYIALSPAVSPDGKKVAFEEYASGAIYVMDIK